MKIRLLTDRCGPEGEQSWGDVIELSNDEALRMIASQQAERVETTMRGGFENASHNHKRTTRK